MPRRKKIERDEKSEVGRKRVGLRTNQWGCLVMREKLRVGKVSSSLFFHWRMVGAEREALALRGSRVEEYGQALEGK